MIEKFKNLLLLKSHSAGIGDILRSSAAWKAIKNKSPNAKLHLLFITNHPGYPSKELMKKTSSTVKLSHYKQRVL
jgi:hypothetical protein